MWKKPRSFTSISPRFLLGLVTSVAVLLAALCGGSDERPANLDCRARGLPPAASPREAYASFRKSMVEKDWRSEYECYTPKGQARFSYIIVVSALRLEFESDLYLRVEETLARHGIPDGELTEFWPNPARDVIVGSEDQSDAVAKWQKEYQATLDRWERQIMPKIKDCPEMIASLKPLILTAAQRKPHSAVADIVEMLNSFAFGRIQELQTNGNQVTATIRIKSLQGSFVQPDDWDESQPDCRTDGDASRTPERFSNLVLVDPNSYREVWIAARELQAVAKAVPRPRHVVIGLGTGDIAVELEGEDLEDAGIDSGVSDDEGQEFDLANNGTRTVTTGEIHLQNIQGRWRIDSIDYR